NARTECGDRTLRDALRCAAAGKSRRRDVRPGPPNRVLSHGNDRALRENHLGGGNRRQSAFALEPRSSQADGRALPLLSCSATRRGCRTSGDLRLRRSRCYRSRAADARGTRRADRRSRAQGPREALKPNWRSASQLFTKFSAKSITLSRLATSFLSE